MNESPHSIAPIDDAAAAFNPFATRFVRPGAIAYRFADHSIDAEQLAERLASLRWAAQVIGPHGSGKSTLIAMLEPALERRGKRLVRHTLADLAIDVPSLFADASWDHDTLLIVDGYERLNWLDRWRLAWRRRAAGAGILATAHRDVGFPTLFRTETSAAGLAELVATLQAGHPSRVHEADAIAAFAAQRGNVREALFDLYDLYESRRTP